MIFAGTVSVFCLLIIFFAWTFAVQPNLNKVQEAQADLERSQVIVKGLQNEIAVLRENDTLLESGVITEMPQIANGVDFEEYFQELKTIDQTLAIEFVSIQYEFQQLYPEMMSAERQVRKALLSIDYVGDTAEDLLAFVQRIEEASRFAKVREYSYRANTLRNTSDYSYSATITIEMPYVSTFETGKPIE